MSVFLVGVDSVQRCIVRTAEPPHARTGCAKSADDHRQQHGRLRNRPASRHGSEFQRDDRTNRFFQRAAIDDHQLHDDNDRRDAASRDRARLVFVKCDLRQSELAAGIIRFHHRYCRAAGAEG